MPRKALTMPQRWVVNMMRSGFVLCKFTVKPDPTRNFHPQGERTAWTLIPKENGKCGIPITETILNGLISRALLDPVQGLDERADDYKKTHAENNIEFQCQFNLRPNVPEVGEVVKEGGKYVIKSEPRKKPLWYCWR